MLCLALAGGLSACIDEDLSNCGADLALRYRMHVQENISSTLTNELNAPEELAIRQLLGEALNPVFSDVVRDLQLHFYDAQGSAAHYEEHIINANSSSFTVYLPVQQYRHHALANQQAEPLVTEHDLEAQTAHRLHREQADTIDAHAHGVFAGTLDLDIIDNSSVVNAENQTFDVDLYMVNCATALVIDLDGHVPDQLYAHAYGFADSYAVDNSTYAFTTNHAVRTIALSDGDQHRALYSVHLPSKNAENRADDGLWSYDCVVQMNGTYTRTQLSVSSPARAGTLSIIKAKLHDNGSLGSDSQEVGVSVTLDWKPGGSHDVPID